MIITFAAKFNLVLKLFANHTLQHHSTRSKILETNYELYSINLIGFVLLGLYLAYQRLHHHIDINKDSHLQMSTRLIKMLYSCILL